jgi:hypothetical protein
MSIKHIVAAAAVVLSGQAFAAVNVVNGSFEEPVIQSGFFQNLAGSFAGWSVTGDVDVVREFGGQGWAAQSGVQSLDLNGLNAGSISQSISGFDVGQQYQLSYWYNSTNTGGAKTSITFLGGTSEVAPIFDTVSTLNSGWLQRTVNFTALTNTVGLSFVSVTGGVSGMAIDSVTIAAVPEPHEWAMMLAGLGLVGFVAQRKRRQSDSLAAAA